MFKPASTGLTQEMRIKSLGLPAAADAHCFANLLEIDCSYLGGIERGERNPSLKFIYRICDAIAIRPEELFK